MQSHEDRDFYNQAFTESALPQVDMAKLKQNAERIMASEASRITAGAPGEQIIEEWQAHGVHVIHRPNDPSGCLRLSIGGGSANDKEFIYCVFRGDVHQCANALRKALRALESPRAIRN